MNRALPRPFGVLRSAALERQASTGVAWAGIPTAFSGTLTTKDL